MTELQLAELGDEGLLAKLSTERWLAELSDYRSHLAELPDWMAAGRPLYWMTASIVMCDLWRFVFSCAPSQQEGDRGERWQQQRRSHLSTLKLWYSFSFTVATDHVWIDLCPVPAIEILIFNYQMLSEWKWYYKMSTHRVVCFASVYRM
jgi:hypothetical protein